ncbi:MAG: DUF1109 family protein [Myxococcales bacterium]|nr:DUF1109 family protein [Myxococcales bacterium]
MNDPREPLDGLDLGGAPPPLPAELAAELDHLAPVRPRRPARQAAVVVLASLGWAVAMVGLLTVRRDLDELPRTWLYAYLAAWLIGFVVPTVLVVVPGRRAMMPRWVPATAIAAVATAGFIVAGLALARSGPSSLHRGLASWAGCLSTGLATALVPIALMALALRGAAPTATRLTAAAIGAAAGAIGGFMLHLHCPIADALHVGVIHGGVAVLAAIGAAALLPRWLAVR